MLSRRRVYQIGILAGALTGTLIAAKNNDWEFGTIGVMRFGRAATTVLRVAVDYKWSLRATERETKEYRDILSEVHLRSAKRLLDLCCLNGGAYIKVGQHIGALEYLLPIEYVNTMKILHSGAPQSPLKDIFKVIREDLHKEPNEIFAKFDEEPLGAASLAQVHRAILKDGRVVAVKVQYPRVKRHANVDMKTMELLMKLMTAVFPDFKFMWLAEEMKKNLPIELQFLNEGQNAEKVAEMFRHFKWLKIPYIHWDLSTDRILTMEYIRGGQINDKKYMVENNINVQSVSKKLSKLYSEMIFVQGFVHCDPHPGNLLVQATPNGPNIVLLDHGLYQTLTDEFRIVYSKLWMALLSADVERIKEHATALGCKDMYILLASMVTARSWASVQEGINEIKITTKESESIKNNVAHFLPQITQVLNQVPRQMLLIFKTNDLLRGIEFSLRSKPGDISFITMTRCCLRAMYKQKLLTCNTFCCKFKACAAHFWGQFRVSIYVMYTQLREFYVIRFLFA